jgi:hypothetical protein
MGLVSLQNHTQLLKACIAFYPPNHRHAGANTKKSARRGVVISAVKDLSQIIPPLQRSTHYFLSIEFNM